MHMLALEMTHSDDMYNAACPFPCLLQVGAASHHYAELAGRSETNAVDVVRAAGAGGLGWCGGQDCRQKLYWVVCFRGLTSCFGKHCSGAQRSALHSLCAMQAMALNDMGTSIGQLRDFIRSSSVRTDAELCATCHNLDKQGPSMLQTGCAPA